MHEKQQREGLELRYPGVYDAAQDQWEQLAAPSSLEDEFRSNYLGSWLDTAAFAVDLARDLGLPDGAGQAIADELARSGELAVVSDEHGVHVFISPEEQPSAAERTTERLRHLQLVPQPAALADALTPQHEGRGPDCA